MSSHSGAYSRLVSPAPKWESGRKRVHSSADFALSFSSSMIGGMLQRLSASASWSWYVFSFG